MNNWEIGQFLLTTLLSHKDKLKTDPEWKSLVKFLLEIRQSAIDSEEYEVVKKIDAGFEEAGIQLAVKTAFKLTFDQ
ncbi:MAG: hypothetical protein AAF824_08230 [Bacteroidota bacterium]